MSHPPDPTAIPQPGDLLGGKYAIQKTLGAGGMGVVLAAKHLDLNQLVAIKFLNAQFSQNPEIVARFLREARAAAAIRSEHVARVHDVTRTEAGVPYLVMEHLEGVDLEQLVRARGPLPIAETVDYVLQACEALAEAHAAGIVHRDLKPGNLFLAHRADGSSLVKVLDFGMSKMAAMEGAPHDGSLTSPVAMLGSPWYMSPEQVKSSKYVDHRTDVWSLGIILHKLITGGPAFEAETLSSCLVKIVTEPPVTLRSRRPDAPAELEAVILRCLEKDLSRRLQNVAELAWALLPFAPERSRVSVERIVRVLLGSDVLTEKTLPLSAAAAAPFPIVHAPSAEPPTQLRPAPAPAPAEPSTAAVASAPRLAPKPSPRWPLVVSGVFVLLAGAGLVAVRLLGNAPTEPVSAALTTATGAPSSVITSVPLEPAPVAATASAEPAPAAGTASPRPAAAPEASHAPLSRKPAASSTAAPSSPPAKRKVTGPLEPNL